MYNIVEYCNDRGRINNYCRSEQSAPSRPCNARPYAPQTNQLLSPNRKIADMGSTPVPVSFSLSIY